MPDAGWRWLGLGDDGLELLCNALPPTAVGFWPPTGRGYHSDMSELALTDRTHSAVRAQPLGLPA